MTNTKALKQRINQSGYKMKFVAAACGLTYNGFYKKLIGKTEFKASEIEAVSNLLHLTGQERTLMFFYEGGVFTQK